MKDRSVFASGQRAGTLAGFVVVITTRSLSSTLAQSIQEQVSTSSPTSDTTTRGAAVIPRRPRSRYTGHDPMVSSRLSGVMGSRPSTTASASDTATRDSETRCSEPSPRKRKTTLPHVTTICGVHNAIARVRTAPRHQPWRARSGLHRRPREARSRPWTRRNEPHRQPRRLVSSDPHRQPCRPPSGPHGQSRRARTERSKRLLVTASG